MVEMGRDLWRIWPNPCSGRVTRPMSRNILGISKEEDLTPCTASVGTPVLAQHRIAA